MCIYTYILVYIYTIYIPYTPHLILILCEGANCKSIHGWVGSLCNHTYVMYIYLIYKVYILMRYKYGVTRFGFIFLQSNPMAVACHVIYSNLIIFSPIPIVLFSRSNPKSWRSAQWEGMVGRGWVGKYRTPHYCAMECNISNGWKPQRCAILCNIFHTTLRRRFFISFGVPAYDLNGWYNHRTPSFFFKTNCFNA